MNDDPLLGYLTLLSIFIVFFLTHLMAKKKQKHVFLFPLLALGISFPIFFLLVIIQGGPYTALLFYLCLSLWNGGFFGLFYAWYLHAKLKRHKSINQRR